MGPVAASGVALALTLCLAPAVLRALRWRQILDNPNERSSHEQPTIRGGGLAPAAGTAVALLLCTSVGGTARAGVLVVAVVMGLVGLVDDLWGLGALPRLAAQILVASASLPWLADSLRSGWQWRVAFGVAVVLWLIGYVNTFNFMDGINGISAAQVVVAGVTWWLIGRHELVPSLAAGGPIVAAGALGFAPFNVVRPRMFLGDVGSYFLGGWLAALAVVGLRSGLPPEAVLAPLAVYCADVLTTLGRRVLRHEKWYRAHREHAYQRLVRGGWSHVQSTMFAGGAMALCAALGALSLTGSSLARFAGDLLICGVIGAYLASPTLVSHRRTSAAPA